MKRFKIVEHWDSPDNKYYRVYERRFLFFWQYLEWYNNVESCVMYIERLLAEEEAERQFIKNTPKQREVRRM